ncbi:hypothetical protein [Streptomyces sp. PR69]|uniref:hypothetical protein n=1 Tax=Streptomyces sp. PR69 TaxID=2984950 RepID=UPI0022645CDD|nr:hypothetical protein [Streptomyces sp. PR69]
MGARLSWSWQAWGVLLQDIQNAYRDISAPRRSFALVAARSQPYRDLIDDLSGIAALVDDTDINCDVCFSYTLKSHRQYFVRLSMVGLYATFARVDACGCMEFIASRKDSSSDIERDVLRLLKARGFHVLSEDQLDATVDLALPGLAHVKVYNALFFPEEELSLKNCNGGR